MTHAELFDAARRHAALARINVITNKQAATDLWKMALDYQQRAGVLGEKPTLGDPPSGILLEKQSRLPKVVLGRPIQEAGQRRGASQA
jgi:hypothetical protein